MEAANQQTAVEAIEVFEEARITDSSVYETTVGYGDKYPFYDGEDLIVEMNNNATGIHHRNRNLEKGYDQTHFGKGKVGAKQFVKTLRTVGLDPVNDFIRVYRDLGKGCESTYPDYWLYVWVNNEIMIATTNNPINGDPASENILSEQGDAGYIGVGGEPEIVNRATNTIDALAQTIKDKQDDGLFF